MSRSLTRTGRRSQRHEQQHPRWAPLTRGELSSLHWSAFWSDLARMARYLVPIALAALSLLALWLWGEDLFRWLVDGTRQGTGR